MIHLGVVGERGIMYKGVLQNFSFWEQCSEHLGTVHVMEQLRRRSMSTHLIHDTVYDMLIQPPILKDREHPSGTTSGV